MCFSSWTTVQLTDKPTNMFPFVQSTDKDCGSPLEFELRFIFFASVCLCSFGIGDHHNSFLSLIQYTRPKTNW